MRITPELIFRSPAFVNALKLRELDLRANKIPAIENLGVTEDRYEALDLSDNHITRLENFPLLSRLQLLMLCNNRVARILPGLGVALPSLETLILTNNALARLEDLTALRELDGSLRQLSLLGNPVQQRPHYRLFVIYMLPRLRVLDFNKVHYTERRKARELFGSEEGKELANTIEAQGTFEIGEGIPGSSAAATKKTDLTDEEVQLVKAAMEKATTMEEVQKLENALVTGILPPLLVQSEAKTAETESGKMDETAEEDE
mmetsp:Transcript_7946/g.20003  ORF Transcript_7946/g.20003 Transcript_7946/m.20003 type:complete len:260 (-) Transcript_7946:97-876(-)